MRRIVWFSCGAASAVAAKIAVERYGAGDVLIVYCAGTAQDEHPDNVRFLKDVQRWTKSTVLPLFPRRRESVADVWERTRYIVGVRGASCTRVLKREVREEFQQTGDVHTLGYTADELDRAHLFQVRHPDLELDWLLIRGGITKADCYRILQAAGIELPEMYKLGFNNNNCIGCCKGGKGYWNRIRAHFPTLFEQRAALQRRLNVQFGGGDYRFFLDELPTDAGIDDSPDLDCGLFCNEYTKLTVGAT